MSVNNNEGTRGEQNQPVDQRLMMEAITGQLQTLMRQMANIQEEMGEMRVEREPRANEGRRNQAAPRQQRVQPWQRRNGEEEYEDNDYDEGGPDRRRFEQGRRDNRREDDNLGNIKSKIPEFKGRNDSRHTLSGRRGSRMSSTSTTPLIERR